NPCCTQHVLGGFRYSAASTGRALAANSPPTSRTEIFQQVCDVHARFRRTAFSFASVCLGQVCRCLSALCPLLGRRPELFGYPFRYWSHSPSPHCCRFREANGERAHQSTVAVPLFEEPLALQRLAGDPV